MTPKQEWISERSAIAEYDGGLQRANADALAEWLAQFYYTGEED